MSDQNEVLKAKLLLAENEKWKIMNLFSSLDELSVHLNKLIESTPTGEERNNYTNINIMHLHILEQLEEFKLTIK